MNDDLENLTTEQKETLHLLVAMGTPAVIRLIRIAEEDKQREWLFALIRKTAAWVFGIVAALVVFRDNILALFRGAQP